MKISLEGGASAFRIRGYATEGITVGERVLTRSFILSPDGLIENWPPRNRLTLCSEHLGAILDLSPELVILGTGRRLEFPSAEVLRPLLERHLGVEVMTTDAACRTYNVLFGEDRRVVAGFMLEG
jgi:uncharacterized protein